MRKMALVATAMVGFAGQPAFGATSAVGVTDRGFSRGSVLIQYGDRVRWEFDASNSQDHRVKDATGMQLFDSALQAPAATFSFRFISAGKYAVTDPTDGAAMMVKVQMTVEPPSGTVMTHFVITWATKVAPKDFKYLVKYQTPLTDNGLLFNFSDQTLPSNTDWTPDRGAGTYLFRARYQSTHMAGQPHSRWSPIVTVTVTS
jgi:plastocyanin